MERLENPNYLILYVDTRGAKPQAFNIDLRNGKKVLVMEPVKGGKLAILSGMVTSGRVFPETLVDPTGRPVDVLTGSSTDARGNATHFEVIADLKFRDINDSFRVVAAVGATGVFDRDIGDDVANQFKSFVTVRNIIFAIVILIVIWFVMRFVIRVR